MTKKKEQIRKTVVFETKEEKELLNNCIKIFNSEDRDFSKGVRNLMKEKIDNAESQKIINHKKN